MKLVDKIIIVSVLILMVLHFYLPYVQEGENFYNAYEALKYKDLHWGFYYVYIMEAMLLVNLLIFLFLRHDKYRRYYHFGGLMWFLSIVVMGVAAIPVENYLKDRPELGLKSFANIDSIFAVSLFAFLFLALTQLLNGMSEKMARDRKQVSNEKFERYIKNKKILRKTNVYFSTKWYFMFTGIKPSKMVLTPKEIVIATKDGYMSIPHKSIENVKKNWGGTWTGGIFTPFRIYLKNGIMYRISWTVDGGMVGSYSVTKGLYEDVLRLWQRKAIISGSDSAEKFSGKTWLRYMIYSFIIYGALRTRSGTIILVSFLGIGVLELIVKYKKKIKHFFANSKK